MKKLVSILSAVFVLCTSAAYGQSVKNISVNASFQDTKGHWASQSIASVVALDLMKGYQNNHFGANKKVSREELAAIIVRLADIQSSDKGLSFNDTKSRWSEQVVSSAIAHQLMQSVTQEKFGATAFSTRGEAASVIQRVLELKKISDSNNTMTFNDIQSSTYAKDIQKIAGHGIMGGYKNNVFAPDKNVTRAELASILVRAYEVIHHVKIEVQPAVANVASTQTSTPSKKVSPVVFPTKDGNKTASGSFNDAQAKKVLDLVNAERERSNLQPLTWSDELQDGTNLRAAEITSLFSHTRPNGEQWHTVGTGTMGENIAAGYASSEAVVKGWMNSKGHRDNIMNPRWTKMSVSAFQESSSEQRNYWAQHFN